MGLEIDRDTFAEAEYAAFAERLRQNLAALQEVLGRPGFGKGEGSLGAELELSIVDGEGRALALDRQLVADDLAGTVQPELDRFNIEYNLTPVALAGRPFTALAEDMARAIAALDRSAAAQAGRVVPIGILPTLREADLQSEAMSDVARYRALSKSLRRLRRHPFRVEIAGDEPLSVLCDDVTLEGANTSLQIHLRVDPEDFADVYNAAQLATPLALALGANSPVMLGHLLWDETRVALFKQTVDSRVPEFADWRRPARVSFGHGWVRRSAFELFAEAVSLFPPLIPVIDDEDPLAVLGDGGLPALRELRLHQGTVWRWNRAIYDPSAGGHLRVEMRALPSGPSPLDMMASAAWLVGLALGLARKMDGLTAIFPFEYAHYNFYRAARCGLDAELLWPFPDPPSPRPRPVREVAAELVPVAEQGLQAAGVDAEEIRRYLDLIRARLTAGMTPARWQRRMIRRLRRGADADAALTGTLEAYLRELQSGKPVTEWREQP